jgi:hypothetical protein
MENIREFEQYDWDGFAGAEEFEDMVTDPSPFYAETEGGDVVIGDADGITVYPADEHEPFQFYFLEVALTKTVVRAIMEALPDVLSEAVMDEFGFEYVT